MAAGLLTQQSVIWALPSGASSSRLIRCLGQGFLALSGIMAVAWSAELCRDLWVNQQHRAVIVLVVLASLAWCFQVGRLWRHWSGVNAALRLHWTGDTTEQPHWRVIEWKQPVSVRVACDFQDWILLDVKSLSSDAETPRSVWSWVRGRDDLTLESNSSVATAHRLRALLYQARRDTAQPHGPDGLAPQAAVGRRSLASWARATFPGSNLARTVYSRTKVSRLHRDPSKGSRAEPWPATEFQATQWSPRGGALDDAFEDDAATGSGRQSGGGH